MNLLGKDLYQFKLSCTVFYILKAFSIKVVLLRTSYLVILTGYLYNLCIALQKGTIFKHVTEGAMV
jgi:hypothetical protein